MNIQRTAFVFLLILFLSSCNGTTADKESRSVGLIEQHPCSVANYQATCGSLPVYENPSLQSGRTINLNVAIVKARGSNPAPDPVFFLAGGPGEAATESTGNIEFIVQNLGRERDIVLVDQRGTGGSHAVIAPASPDFSGLSGEELDAAVGDWIEKTLAELDMDTRYYSTSVAMDDLEAVRQALGYEEINLFGTSYGATAAQYYLRQHEDHVRTAVLIGGSLLDAPVFQRQATNAQRTLELAFSQCEADPACQAAFPNLRLEFAALLDRLEKQPVEVTLENGSVILTRDFFAAKVQWITRDSRRIASLPLWIHQAYENNDWTEFAEADISDWGPLVMSIVIRCSEKWASFKPPEVARESGDSYLAGWTISQAETLAMICKYLPKAETSEGLSPQPPSQKPVLLFNGEWDLLDPPANVAGAKELWQNGLSLTIPGQSHEISTYSVIMCIGPIIRDFTDRASIDELDTTCLTELLPPIFETAK